MSAIQFTITDGFEKHTFSLPTSSNINNLKEKIHELFIDVLPHLQQYEGWLWEPRIETDTLGKCLDIHTTNKLKIVKKNSNYIIQINQYEEEVVVQRLQPLFSTTDVEIASILCLKRKWTIPSIILEDITLNEAIQVYYSTPLTQRKPIFLYLHGTSFPTFFSDVKFHKITENFTFIGWDIGLNTYHNDLIKALDIIALTPETSRRIIDSIRRKTTYAFCFAPTEVGLETVDWYLWGWDSREDILQELECIYVDYQKCVLKKIIDLETTRINSLKKQWFGKSIYIDHNNLLDAIETYYKAPIVKKKPIFLYFHNIVHPFTELFTNFMKDREISTIIKKFTFVGWDIQNEEYHDALISILKLADLSESSCFINRKEAAAFCIIPLENELDLALRLDISITKQDLIGKLMNLIIEWQTELQNSQQSTGSEETADILQQKFAELLGTRDYNRYEHYEHKYLKNNIGFALYGAPKSESGYSEKSSENIDKIYTAIKTQNDLIAESKGMINLSIIYNCIELCDDLKIKETNPEHTVNVNPIPVFILRKCIPNEKHSSDKPPCRIIIDDICRVYCNWNDYLTNNKLPKCKMTLPLFGKYQLKDDTVMLEKHYSPACDISKLVLTATDITGTIAGLSSGGVFIAATIPAVVVAPAALLGAGIVGAAVGVWGLGRSIANLVDRGTHCQSLSLAEAEVRGAYINIMASVFGFAGAGANIIVSRLAMTGASIGKATIYTCNAFSIINISVNGVSVANSGWDIIDQWIINKKQPSTLSLLQFSASVLFFGHAVYNFRLTGTIIEESQAQSLKDYRDSLRSNRHRKTFDKMVKETLSNSSDSMKGNSEVISSLRNIQNKDETFAALTRNQKAFSKHGIRFSASDGKINLNGIPVEMNEFINFNKKQTNIYLFEINQQRSNLSTAAPTATVNSTNMSSSTTSARFTEIIRNSLGSLSNTTVSAGGILNMIILVNKLMSCLDNDVKTMILNMTEKVIVFCIDTIIKPCLTIVPDIKKEYFEILRTVISFFDDKAQKYEIDYKLYQRTGDQKYYHSIFKTVNPSKAKRFIQFFQSIVKNAYSTSQLLSSTLKELGKLLAAWMANKIFDNDKENELANKRKKHDQETGYHPKKLVCSTCNGFCFIP